MNKLSPRILSGSVSLVSLAAASSVGFAQTTSSVTTSGTLTQ